MKVEPYIACASTDGWYPFRVQSSNEVEVYTVLVNPWGNQNEYICECKGYNFRGKCRHQEVAQKFRCGWSELDNYNTIQTEEQKQQMVCPRCTGPAVIKFRIIDE